MKSFHKNLIAVTSVVVLAIPFIAQASGCTPSVNGGKDLCYIITNTIVPYINTGIYLLMAVATIMFVFYVIKYFIAPSDGAERAEAGKYVMYSLIGFFIVLSIWGLVNILVNTFGLSTTNTSLSDFKNIFPN